jgi:hypothetical protein
MRAVIGGKATPPPSTSGRVQPAELQVHPGPASEAGEVEKLLTTLTVPLVAAAPRAFETPIVTVPS